MKVAFVMPGVGIVGRGAEAFPCRIRTITVGRPTLEDVFVHRTGHAFEEPVAP